MKNTEQISSFIMYNYIPFDKKQCIKRLLVIWVTSFILCFINGPTLPWVLTIGLTDICLSVILVSLIVRYSQSQTSRYLCDGFFWLYISVFLNLTAYKIMVFQGNSNWTLAIVLILSLMVCIFFFILVTLLNIRSGKYSKTNFSKKIVSLPFFCSAIAVLTARLSLQGASQQVALKALAYILLLLSFVTSVPSINLLKAWFYKRYL